MKSSKADIVREYGPFPGITHVHGVSYDGRRVWFASDDRLNALDPDTGAIDRVFEVPADAGTAFDGTYLYQIAEDRIRKIDPRDGNVVKTIPAPGRGGDSGLAWGEGSLWVGQHSGRSIHEIDPETGDIRRTIVLDRMVTGVSWAGGELWHGTWEDDSDLRQIDPRTGETRQIVAMPEGLGVSGLESDGGELFYCGGGSSGLIRAVRKP